MPRMPAGPTAGIFYGQDNNPLEVGTVFGGQSATDLRGRLVDPDPDLLDGSGTAGPFLATDDSVAVPLGSKGGLARSNTRRVTL